MDVLTVASHIINRPGTESTHTVDAGKSGAMSLRSSELVVCSAVDTIMVLLKTVQEQGPAERGESCLSQAWQEKSLPLAHVVANLLAVAKAAETLSTATRKLAVEAVDVMFQVIHGPVERAAFYVPGIVSSMARVVITSSSKGKGGRTSLAAAALKCWANMSSRFLADAVLSDDAPDSCLLVSTPGPPAAAAPSAGLDAQQSVQALRGMLAAAAAPNADASAPATPVPTSPPAAQANAQQSEAAPHEHVPPANEAVAAADATSSTGSAADGLSVTCDAEWREHIGKNYARLLSHALPLAVNHASVEVRRAALLLVRALLLCANPASMRPCLPALVRAAAALSADTSNELVAEARVLVADAARRGRMLEVLSAARHAAEALLLSLPITFRCEADEGLKQLELQLLLGYLRLLQAGESLQAFVDAKLDGLVTALLQCLALSCDETSPGAGPHIVEVPAALRYTAIAASRPDCHAPQSGATTCRGAAWHRVRQRVRQVTNACQRPWHKPNEPGVVDVPGAGAPERAAAASFPDPSTAEDVEQADRPDGRRELLAAREEQEGGTGTGVHGGRRLPPEATAALRHPALRHSLTPEQATQHAITVTTSASYMLKTFRYFSLHGIQDVVRDLVSHLARHCGLYRLVKALAVHLPRKGRTGGDRRDRYAPALWLTNLLLSSEARESRHPSPVPDAPSGSAAEFPFMGEDGAVAKVDELPSLWEEEGASDFVRPLVLRPPAPTPQPPETAPTLAWSASNVPAAISSAGCAHEAIASVDHVLDAYIALALSSSGAAGSSMPDLAPGYDSRSHMLCKCLALEGFGGAANALGSSFEGKLLATSFPLLAAAASAHADVSTAAVASLERVRAACGYASLQELIWRNADYLVDAICRNLTRASDPLARAARPATASRGRARSRRCGRAAAAASAHAEFSELYVGVDVLHVLLTHVGAEKAALLADSLQAVLSLLELHPSATAAAALAATLPSFVAAVADAAAQGRDAQTLEEACAHESSSAPAADTSDSARQVPGEMLDLAELRLACACGVGFDDSADDAHTVRPEGRTADRVIRVLGHCTRVSARFVC